MAYRFNPFTSQLDFYQEDTQFVSSGGIANLTSGQQDLIREGSIVTTTDGRRWAYSGTGSKTLEASYVELADITPEWSVIANKPAIPTAAPAAGQIMAGNAGGTAFATVSVSGDATLAATGALTITNNAVTTAKLADNSVTSAKIANGTITNDDMFANAAIGLAKLANLPSGQVVVGNATNVPTATAISGDATLSNTGALTISAGAIGTSKLGGDITAAGKALLDDANTAAQRSTLGLGNSSTLNVGTTTGTVAAGDDSRLSDARTPTAHTHGNISNTGTIGSTAGLPVVTTTSGALTTLPLGTAGQALVVNSGATALEFATPVGGVTSVTGTSPIASSGGTTPAISIADAAADGTTKGAAAFNASDFNSASGVISLDYTNGQSASASNKGFLTSADWTTFNNKTGGSVGSVDNAVLRADVGTGIVQNSGLIVEDAIESFTSITGDAGTDVITATGSAFANGQPIRFTSLTGGSGLNTTTNYFVREASGATFKVETSIGGGAINFTTNITAGTLLTGHSVSTNVTLSENTTATNSDLVLTPKGTGALIAGPKPDGTATGGNARGARSVDLQTSRGTAAQVASGANAVICGGSNNTSSSPFNFVGAGASNSCGGSDKNFIGAGDSNLITGGGFGIAIVSGASNSASGTQSFIGSGRSNVASGDYSVVAGGGVFAAGGNTSSATTAAILGGHAGVANRYAMQAHAAGRFSADGDAQRARFVLRCKTTTNAAVEMALDGSTTYLGIPSGKVIACTINISGVKSDGSAVAHYVRQYAVKNVGGTSSEVYAPVTIGTDNAAGTVIALSANNTDDTLRIAVTGIAAETWRWVASVDAVEIAYGT